MYVRWWDVFCHQFDGNTGVEILNSANMQRFFGMAVVRSDLAGDEKV